MDLCPPYALGRSDPSLIASTVAIATVSGDAAPFNEGVAACDEGCQARVGDKALQSCEIRFFFYNPTLT